MEKIEDEESVPVLYIGSYFENASTIVRMQSNVEEQSSRLRSHSREVHLSDTIKAPPARLKNIIGHPC